MLTENIIKVFFDDKGYPFKDQPRTVRFPIVGQAFLGASNTTKIRFYYELLGNSSTAWVSEAKRPDGQVGNHLLSKNSDENGRYAELSLNAWYTQCKGDLFISLKGFQGDSVTVEIDDETNMQVIYGQPVVQATGSIKLAINYAPIGPVANYQDEILTYQNILTELGNKLDVNSSIVVIDTITSVDTSIYEDGQLFYIKDRHHLYKFVSGNFVVYKDYLVIDENELYDNSMLLTQEQKNILLANDDFLVVYFDGGNDFLMYEKREESDSELVYHSYSISHNESTRVIEIKDNELHIYKSDYEVEMVSYVYDTYDTYKLDNLVSLDPSAIGTISATNYAKINKFPSYLMRNNRFYIHCTDDNDYLYFREFNLNYLTAEGNSYTYRESYIKVAKSGTHNYSWGTEYTNFYSKNQNDAKFGNSIQLSIDSNYDLVVKLLNANGVVIDQDDVDLPLESIIVSATYYNTYTYNGTTYTNVLVITLATTDVPTIVPLGDLISGLVSTSTFNTAMAGKQDTLVSAINIKTINGSSILGSGDFVISSATPDFATNSEIDALFE